LAFAAFDHRFPRISGQTNHIGSQTLGTPLP
jgi:hypothetical protein